MERVFLIDVHYACFGIVANDGTVVESAPIAAWMRGKTLQEIRPWVLSKKAKVVEIK
jgi:hypothetical protein